VLGENKKEHHVSAGAFLNWLVKTERVLANPLSKLDMIEVRGTLTGCRMGNQRLAVARK
jgi:hypothetical protein